LIPRELGEMIVGGHAIVAAGDAADHELDGLLIALGQRARSDHRIGSKHRLERGGTVGGDGREGVRHAADRLLDLGIDLTRRAGVGFEIRD